MGFEFYNYDQIRNEINCQYWKYINTSNLETGRFVLSNRKKSSSITYQDILKLKGYKIKKIENPEIDPYNEDDWGIEIVEKKLHPLTADQIFLKNSFIPFESIQKAIKIANLLIDNGFEINYNSDEIADLIRKDYWDCFFFLNNNRLKFSLTHINYILHHRDNILTYNELKHFFEKGKNKIKNPELDPYEEEDWKD